MSDSFAPAQLKKIRCRVCPDKWLLISDQTKNVKCNDCGHTSPFIAPPPGKVYQDCTACRKLLTVPQDARRFKCTCGATQASTAVRHKCPTCNKALVTRDVNMQVRCSCGTVMTVDPMAKAFRALYEAVLLWVMVLLTIGGIGVGSVWASEKQGSSALYIIIMVSLGLSDTYGILSYYKKRTFAAWHLISQDIFFIGCIIALYFILAERETILFRLMLLCLISIRTLWMPVLLAQYFLGNMDVTQIVRSEVPALGGGVAPGSEGGLTAPLIVRVNSA